MINSEIARTIIGVFYEIRNRCDQYVYGFSEQNYHCTEKLNQFKQHFPIKQIVAQKFYDWH